MTPGPCSGAARAAASSSAGNIVCWGPVTSMVLLGWARCGDRGGAREASTGRRLLPPALVFFFLRGSQSGEGSPEQLAAVATDSFPSPWFALRGLPATPPPPPVPRASHLLHLLRGRRAGIAGSPGVFRVPEAPGSQATWQKKGRGPAHLILWPSPCSPSPSAPALSLQQAQEPCRLSPASNLCGV